LRQVTVTIEAPRGARVKRRADGRLDYVSPLPVPFNYGSVAEEQGGDGDPLDAIVLGARLARGTRREVFVHGVVRFLDGGLVDDKLVCADQAPTDADWRAVEAFFVLFSRAKRALNAVRGVRGVTRFVRVDRSAGGLDG
jgi:inorganic pyrophosphatase